MLAIIDEPLANERVMLEERGGAVADEKIHRRVRKRAPQILEQRGREYDIAEASQLHEQDLARMRDARRLHSGSRHSFAYCTKA